MVNEKLSVSFTNPPQNPTPPGSSIGLGWGLSEVALSLDPDGVDGSLMSIEDDEWVQPETINAKIDRLENHIIKLTEEVKELMKFFWN